jgi:hypothetical protein
MSIPLELETVLKDFATRRLWGRIEIDFQHGELVVIRRQESIKPKLQEGTTYERSR